MVDLIAKALLAGILLATIASCLGCVIQWRRMAFFSDALAHSSLLGIGLSLLLGTHIMIGIAFVLAVFVALIYGLGDRRLPADSVLALCAYLALAGGTVMLYLSGSRVHWEGLLFGNILALTTTDLYILGVATVVLVLVFWRLWPSLLALAVNREIAMVELSSRKLTNLLFLLLVCLYVAVGVRMIGVLLLNALLVIPAATARFIAMSPGQMVGFAIAFGCLSIGGGIAATFTWDVPAAPACVLFAGALFALVWCYSTWRQRNHNN